MVTARRNMPEAALRHPPYPEHEGCRAFPLMDGFMGRETKWLNGRYAALRAGCGAGFAITSTILVSTFFSTRNWRISRYMKR